jgi:O-antigen/teichoic acid export membrane protein
MSVPHQNDRVTRSAIVALTIRIVSAAVAYLSHVMLARWLSIDQYGLFATVWTWLLIVGGTLPLGLNVAVIGQLPRYFKAGDIAHARGLAVSAVGLTLALSGLVAFVGIALIAWQPAMVPDSLAPLAVLAICCLPLIALSEISEGLARAMGWIGSALVPTYIARPLLILAFGGALYASGADLNAATILGCALCATAATALTQAGWIAMRLLQIARPGPATTDLRPWLILSAPMLVTEVSEMLLASLDLFFVAAWVGAGDAGLYFAAQRSIALVAFVNFAVGAATANTVAASVGNRTLLAQEVRRAATLSFWPSLAGALALVAASPYLLLLFGPEFAEGTVIVAILAAGFVARSLVGPAELLLNVVGAARACAVILTSHLVLAFALNVLLVPTFGAIGAALAAAMTMISLSLSFAAYAWFRLDLVMMPSSPLPEIIRLAEMARWASPPDKK